MPDDFFAFFGSHAVLPGSAPLSRQRQRMLDYNQFREGF